MAVSKPVEMLRIIPVWVILCPACYEQLEAYGDSICVRVLLRNQKSQQKLTRNLDSHPDLDLNFISAFFLPYFLHGEPTKMKLNNKSWFSGTSIFRIKCLSYTLKCFSIPNMSSVLGLKKSLLCSYQIKLENSNAIYTQSRSGERKCNGNT